MGLGALAARTWSARRETLVGEISARSGSHPIHPDWLALQIVEAMPDRAILVDEALTSSRHIPALREHRDRYGYHGLASGSRRPASRRRRTWLRSSRQPFAGRARS